MSRVIASGKKATDFVLFEKRFEVPDYDNPTKVSRTRWRIIHTPWFGIYLHLWNKPDPRPTLHNHPWVFFSIILRGFYGEARLIPSAPTINFGSYIWHHRLIKWFNVVKRTDFHTVSLVEPGTISLMFVGKTHQG